MQRGRILRDHNLIDCVARESVVERTGISIGLAVECYVLIVADTEMNRYLHQGLHRQVDTIEHTVPVITSAGELIFSRLTVRHAVPCDGLGWAYNSHGVNCIHVINR